MTENEIWRGIIETYVPDDETEICLEEANGLYIMAVYCRDMYPSLRLYTGDSYKSLMFNSNYIEGLWGQDDEYLEEMFTEDEIEAIKRSWEED